MSLWRYIQGFRKGREANRIEKEAMEDPFLADALDGYEQVKGDHSKKIKNIEKKIPHQTLHNLYSNQVLGVAACLIVLISAGTFFYVYQRNLTKSYQITEFSDSNLPPELAYEKRESSEPAKEENLEVGSPPAIQFTPPTISKDEEVRNEELMLSQQELIEAEKDITAAIADKNIDIAEIQEHKVIVEEDTKSEQLAVNATTPALRSRIKGEITDEKGEPLIGASVSIDGTNKGTITDTSGYFEIETNDKEKIKIAYLGYESVTLPADTSQTILIAMKEDKQLLEEVVVVNAYGKKTKDIAASTHKESQEAIVSKTPEPIVGKKNYQNYLKEALKYPTDDCKDVKGKVVIQFNVDSEGRPHNLIILQSLCESADKEAIRLIKEGSAWTLGDKEVKMEIKF